MIRSIKILFKKSKNNNKERSDFVNPYIKNDLIIENNNLYDQIDKQIFLIIKNINIFTNSILRSKYLNH